MKTVCGNAAETVHFQFSASNYYKVNFTVNTLGKTVTTVIIISIFKLFSNIEDLHMPVN